MWRSLIVVVCLGGIACGDDNNGSPTAPPPPSNLFSLSGTVTSSGAGVPGASVTVMDGVNKGQGRTTDSGGTFTFTNLTASSFTLQASAAGYSTQNRAVNLTSNQAVSFTLDKINPIFVQAGIGDNVFTIPSYVQRIRIQATYGGFAQNFIVRIAGSLIVNELMGSGFNQTSFTGTYLTAGGTVAITSSSGVSWTFTEVR